MEGENYMNSMYRTPLFTSWPLPLSDETMKELLGLKKKPLIRKAKKNNNKDFYFPSRIKG